MNHNIFLWMQLCFLVAVKAHYETVKVRIRNGNEIIELNWKRTEQYLANQNLPVWYAGKNEEPNRISHIFERIGEFVTYHDVAKSSAVVYIVNCNCFHGLIDTRFYITELPLSNPESNVLYEVGAKYVFTRKDQQNGERFHDSPFPSLHGIFTEDELKYINSIISPDDTASAFGQSSQQNQNAYDIPSTSVRNVLLPDGHQAEPSTERLKVLYPEILIFITNDVYKTFINVNVENGGHWLVLHYIIYFNAIDMLFAKLTSNGILVHINIAGLVIETEYGAFPYRAWKYELPKTRIVSYCHDGATLLDNHLKYIHKYKNIFVQDSFDFFFISTNYGIESKGAMVHAKLTPMFDMLTRKTTPRVQTYSLGLVVQRVQKFGDYVTATYHIAHLMDIKSEMANEELNSGDQQCSAIMQSRQTHCENCLNWSEQSRNDLRAYVRSNSNHCFLLNYPRSLYPYGQPVLSLNPEDQCMCYKYPSDTLNPFYIMSIPANSCDKLMQCTYNQKSVKAMPLPIDGTPCGGPHQVCWRKKCVSL